MSVEDTRFDSIDDAIKSIARGEIIVVVDDEDRENEGDLICAAEVATPEIINFMARYGRGLICLPLDAETVQRLRLPLMVSNNETPLGTNFTVSIEATSGVTTGISAADRARTVQAAIAPEATFGDIRSPGHIFPLLARQGGVLRRAGHTEAAVDLATMAGMRPGGVICEIMNDDGTMARGPQLREFADQHKLLLITIKDLIEYRKRNETLVIKQAEALLPSEYGDFRVIGFQSALDDSDYVALVKGEWEPDEAVLVRVHSECLTGDVFGSFRCDCGPQLHAAMEMVESEGKGVILYLPQEGRGIGLINKLRAYKLQEEGADTVEANQQLGFKADLRDYGMGAQMLFMLGVRRMRLMTNNPRKIVGVQGHGLEVVERIPLEIESNPGNKQYMHTKKHKLGHILNI
ncbi:MAG: bifunctional 3,4-dihydroxy-2-butanone-4-phosphate synthase/GTP cyclohydrolase II [SAR324 cluster bacterium]|nr:bifunctional 3,4-dihydroxy-2-butanone-4-phosphate synthase/GTP cyclohydrolase II [SAR324 cluster bacterium]MBL7035847.1 bifunctional 3,4-dihydroxy-2-butanone-4-phosphate synthase/GTP cyclohydrolase II [SAR324 cluster bacterium]